MSGDQRSNARWIVAALIALLAASAVVMYALVRITNPDAPGSEGTVPTDTVASISKTPITGTSPIDHTPVSPSSTGGTVSPQTTEMSPESSTTATSPSTPPDSSEPHVLVPPTTTAVLAGSGISLPSAWTGTAKITVAVLGECAAAAPSVYSDIPTDLALDVVQNEANSAESAIPPGVRPDALTLTVGVNPSGVPSVALYSSQFDTTGQRQQFWQLTTSAGSGRTSIEGRLIDQPEDGSSPNIMMDAETSLQGCESAGSLSLPRALAEGSTITGTITPSSAHLTLHARTSDGRRLVEVEIDAVPNR